MLFVSCVVMIFLAVSMMGFILRGGLGKVLKAPSALFLLIEHAWGAPARIQVCDLTFAHLSSVILCCVCLF